METIEYPITNPGRTAIVTQVSNGFTITTFDTYVDDPDAWHHRSMVVEDTDEVGYADCSENWDTVARMLWALLEEMGFYTTKHDPKTIDIKVVDRA